MEFNFFAGFEKAWSCVSALGPRLLGNVEFTARWDDADPIATNPPRD